jgi:hypothetical protein
MIENPHFDVEIRVGVRMEALGWPAEGIAAYGEGTNRLYVDLLGSRWRDVDVLLSVESVLLAECICEAQDGQHYLQLLRKGEEDFARRSSPDEEDFIEGAFLDLGVASIVIGLNAAGCPTVSSCSGHGTDLPYVVFFSRPEKIALLSETAIAAAVGFINNDRGSVEVYSDAQDGLIRFAREMRVRATAFKSVRLSRKASEVGDRQLSLTLDSLDSPTVSRRARSVRRRR